MAPSAEERVDLARRGVGMYSEGDVEGALARLHPEIEGFSEGLDIRRFHGIEGFLRWAEEWNEAWERFDRDIRDVQAVGERHVVAVVHQAGRGRDSGIEVSQLTGYLMEVDDDLLCVHFALYLDPERALAAAREREGLGSAD